MAQAMAEASVMQGVKKGRPFGPAIKVDPEESLPTTARNAALAEVAASTFELHNIRGRS
jgi:hypothetical protein